MPRICSRTLTANPSRVGGFTLIELLLVMAIIVVMAGLSYPFFARFVLQNYVSSSADNLAGTLQKAQSYAMAGKDNGAWKVSYANSKITLSNSSGDVFDTYTVPSSVSLVGFNQVTFSDPTGLPSSFASYTVSAGSNIWTVSVNGQGVTSVAD